ncbi:hypothetical protein [Streptomyces sp. NRRL B-24484]|uniref:hypothetical protein n=1 Tax=Streptomyces sp. NRRL B-24484 TaxID=1463833 RepID=UPI0004C210C2|nr:hypothetical protein [Streptomyces sp. NRRL B-24484]
MPKAATQGPAEEGAPVLARRGELEGWTVDHVEFRQPVDGAAVMAGLPGGCSCPHRGDVLRGRTAFRFEDHEEVFGAGDVFHLPPGHVSQIEAGTEIVQFSPTAQLRAFEQAAAAAAGGGPG